MQKNGSIQGGGRSGSLVRRSISASQGPFGSTRARDEEAEEEDLLWAAIERLPTYDRLRKGIISNASHGVGTQIDLQELGSHDKKELVERLVSVPETDNETFLTNLKSRLERVGIDVPSIEVRFENLRVEAKTCIRSGALPTLLNSTMNVLEGILNILHIIPSRKQRVTILQDVSGVVEPKRMTLLLGPPSSGKTTFLLALAGKLDKSLKVSGKVSYNGHELKEFVPQRTAAYVSQDDVHYSEMTVREILEYSARFQGVGYRYEMLAELSRREKAAHLKPDHDIDLFMKAAAVKNQEESIMTHYILKILGLESCADTIVGNHLIRGVSGGQRKRVTTGEILVGPATVLMMDEISTGLDSSTTFQIVKNLSQFVHILNNTIVISLLQPPPETYNLFDDIVLLSDGEIVYQGPREHVLEFFQLMGFQCPQRKGVAEFLQEVISRKDQQQYWRLDDIPYHFIPPKEFAKAFKSFHVGEKLQEKLARPFDKCKNHPNALVKRKYGVGFKHLFKACFAREILLLKRNIFLRKFKLIQLIIASFILTTVFLRSELHKGVVDPDGSLYFSALFLMLSILFFFQSPEIPITISKLPVFYKQRDMLFFPPWVYAFSNWVLEIPIRAFEVAVFVFPTYYIIGYDPNVERCFRQYFLLVLLTESAACLSQAVGALTRDLIVGSTVNTFVVIVMFCLGGFLLPYETVKKWWKWSYWCSPRMYAQNGLAVNEFHGSSWKHAVSNTSSESVGVVFLKSRDMFPSPNWYWIAVGALFGFTFLFTILRVIALSFLSSSKSYQVVVPSEVEGGGQENGSIQLHCNSFAQASTNRMSLHFEPHTLTFDEVWYSVDMPNEMKNQGVLDERLKLLKGVSGSFKPGILTALMGASGAGKTTLMDVLAGRKTGGYIEGDIRVSGYPKKQETFSRISGYCEQTDIHSPHVTIYESLLYSACLRLSQQVDSHTRKMFVDEVIELVELRSLSESLVGLPGVNGLSMEQRKRLTIAVELVANPSIMFMDEPTSGLDARAASVVMRAVRKIVDAGRTIVCTIHQPSIEIFESFDELFLMKRGGQEIYVGPLGHQSISLINYFESIEGMRKIDEGYNPATWMIEVSTDAQECALGVDLVQIYKNSELYRRNKALIQELSSPRPDSKELSFATTHAQPVSIQFTTCLWKQNLSYWRNPRYNLIRLFCTTIIALIIGSMFWDLGGKMSTKQDLLNAMASTYGSIIFIGIQNVFSVQPVLVIERIVMYRERSSQMYSIIPYSLAQIMIEIPYVLVQSTTYSIIVYAMIGFEWSVTKFFWYLYFTFIMLLFYTYFGLATVAATPNTQIASFFAFEFFVSWVIFSGFVISRKLIPKWWRWYYWVCPMAWNIYGLVVSQYGDVEDVLESGEKVKDYLDTYFGFKHHFVGVVAACMVGFVVLFALVFILSIKAFNFQSR